MAKPEPIRLPIDLEREAEEERLLAIQRRIEVDRENGTLTASLIVFLRQFEEKVSQFIHYTNLHTPYPTVSQTIKDIIRDKLRVLNEFYYRFSGSNPNTIIAECLNQSSGDSRELKVLYNRLASLLKTLNENSVNIANKDVIFIRQPSQKEKTYTWT